MKNVQRFFFNAMILSIGSIIIRAILVCFNAYISERAGAEVMGLITLISSVYGFAITLATSGISLAVIRLVSSSLARDDGGVPKIMRCAFIYALIFSSLTSLILFMSASNIGTHLLGDSRTVFSLKLFAIALVPVSISSALNGYFCAVRRVYKNVIAQFFEQGVKIFVASFLLFLIGPFGPESACVAVIFGSVVSEIGSVIISLILYIFDRKIHSRHEKKCKEVCRFFDKVFFAAFPLGVSGYVRSALSFVEHLSIPWGLKKSGASSSYALASYGILHAMVVPLLLFPSCILGSFSSLLVPELASSYAKGEFKRCKYIISRVFSLSLLFSILVSGIFMAYAYEIGYFVYGSYEVGELLRLLAPLVPLMYLDGSVDAILKGLGQQLYCMRVNIADSLISVILIVALLPSFGMKGYIAVVFITELLNTSLSIIKLLDISEVRADIAKWVFKPVGAIVFSSLLSRVIFMTFEPHGAIYMAFKITLTVIAYALISRAIGAISKDDIEWSKSILKREKPS